MCFRVRGKCVCFRVGCVCVAHACTCRYMSLWEYMCEYRAHAYMYVQVV